MRIGAHVSAAGGLHNAPRNAAELGLECFQFFSRPPQGGKASRIGKEEVSLFRNACEAAGLERCYIHTPYVLNLASEKASVRASSVEIIRGELERGSLLGVDKAMTHIGSATAVGEEKGMAYVIEGVRKIMKGYKGSTRLLLEISAGAGNIIGDTFEELKQILDGADDDRIGICFDTAHAFASGYDLRDARAVKATMKAFDDVIGLDLLELSHCNDSKVGLGEKKDRHEHIGDGRIGMDGFKAIVSSGAFADIDLILETQPDKQDRDIAILKRLRNAAKKGKVRR